MVKIKLQMEGHYEDDSPSRNVVAEIKGSVYPDEVIVMGGHIDSWDVGQGAMDDGGEGAVIDHLLLYADTKLAEQIAARRRIDDYDYDWSLNDTAG